MNVIAPTFSEITEGTWEASTPLVTLSSRDRPEIPPEQPSYSSSPRLVARRELQTSVVSLDIDTAAKFTGAGAATAILGFALSEAMGLFCLMVAFLVLFAIEKDQSRIVIYGFAGLLALLLVTAALCVLWNWSQRKKRRGPYVQVTNMFLLTLLRSRQRVKNVYDILPRRQAEPGRRQSRSSRIFSIESLFSRSPDSPHSRNELPHAGDAFQVHRAQTHAVGIYDNATGLQRRGDLTSSAHYINVRTAEDYLSVSSEGSTGYVNVPVAEEIAETQASTNNPPGNLSILPVAPELGFDEEEDMPYIRISDCSSLWSLVTNSDDLLSSDEEGSSQTSNDYVNMEEMDLEASWIYFQGYRDYENVPPASPNGSQCQVEEVTSSNTNHVESRTDGLDTHVQFVMQSGRHLDLGDYVIYQPSTQSENSQMEQEEEMSNEDSNDYDTVLAAKLGDRDSEQEPDTNT